MVTKWSWRFLSAHPRAHVFIAATASSPVPLPVSTRAKVVPEQLISSLDTVEVVVGDLLTAGICKGTDVLCEGRLPGNSFEGQYGGYNQASPRQSKAGNVQDAVNGSPCMLVTPAKSFVRHLSLSKQTCLKPRLKNSPHLLFSCEL